MKTILLVEDDQPLRAVLGLALRRSGYRVIEADSGAAALKMARQHQPDMILSDIDMPGGDGATLLREIRRDSELKSRQVVLITGTAGLLTPHQGIPEGADDSLVKPISLHRLLRCVQASFSRDSLTRSAEDRLVA